MEHRFKYGYSEFNSNNYYHMNLGAASIYPIAHKDDAIMVERMKMCLDLCYDVASNVYDYTFIALRTGLSRQYGKR